LFDRSYSFSHGNRFGALRDPASSIARDGVILAGALQNSTNFPRGFAKYCAGLIAQKNVRPNPAQAVIDSLASGQSIYDEAIFIYRSIDFGNRDPSSCRLRACVDERCCAETRFFSLARISPVGAGRATPHCAAVMGFRSTSIVRCGC
jgi:hypothetical protein